MSDLCEVVDHRLGQVEKRADIVDVVLNGERGRIGLIAKTDIVWRSYHYAINLLSFCGGSAVTYLVTKLLNA